MEMNKKRFDNIDICKGICILAVILGHQLEKFGLKNYIQVVQTFHMPLFFILAGFFVSNSTSKGKYIINRVKRLMVPYCVSCLVAMLLCTTIVWLNNGMVLGEIKRWIWISIYGSGSGNGSKIGSFGYTTEIGMLWFLPALLWSCIIARMISEQAFSGIKIFLISATAIATTTLFGWIPFSIQSGLGAAFWVYIGYYIKTKQYMNQIINTLWSSWLILIFTIWIVSVKYGYIRLYANSYKLGFIDVMGAIAGSWLVFGICDLISKKTHFIKKILAWIGMNSLMIYCLHFIENNVKPVSSELVKIGMTNKIHIAFLSWLIISIVSCVLAFFMGKIPVVKNIYG